MDYEINLLKPTRSDGLFRDISLGHYLKLEAVDQVKIIPGEINGIPQRWGLIAASLAIDTDGNAADRYLYILHLSKNRLGLGGIASNKFTANQVGSWNVGQALYMNAATIPNQSYTGVGAEGLQLEGLQWHEIWIGSAQAGDKWHLDLSYKYLGEGNE